MVENYKGTFTVIDGLDGVGKGVVQKAIHGLYKLRSTKVLDLHKFWETHHDHPDFENEYIKDKINPLYVDLNSFDVMLSSEPSFVGVGSAIRFELTAKNNRSYSAHMIARAFATDRKILYQRVLLPALRAGKHVIQSRSVSTSIVYQPMQALIDGEPELSIDQICRMDGNDYALAHAPSLLIIPTVQDIDALVTRLKDRDKDDNCIFENAEFQRKLKPLYESEVLRNIFESRGTKVVYLDAGISAVETARQAAQVYKEVFPHLFKQKESKAKRG